MVSLKSAEHSDEKADRASYIKNEGEGDQVHGEGHHSMEDGQDQGLVIAGLCISARP